MKKIFTLMCLVMAMNAYSQTVPFNINYQGMARDDSGRPISDTDIEATINILQNDANGPVVFHEKHSTTTNAFGIYIILIGDGDGSDDLRNIDWVDSDYYIETVIKIGNHTELTNVSKINSVPYAFQSYKSVIDEVEDADSDVTNEIQQLSLNGDKLTISKGNVVDLGSLSKPEETVTRIRLNPNNTSFDYIDEENVTTNLDLCNIIDHCETVTSIRFNTSTNSLEYIDEEGIVNIVNLDDVQLTGSISETLTKLTYNSIENHLEYVDEHGNINIVSLGDKNPTGGFLETVTTITDNGDGTYIYTAEDGTQSIIGETTTSIGLNYNGTSFDYIDEDGVVTNLNLCNIIDNCETVTSIIESSNGQLVYKDENGVSNSIDIKNIKEDYPLNASKLVAYAPLSGPEQAIFERGTSQLINGEIFIEFSDHFSKLLNSNTLTVSLTSHSANTYGLAVIEKSAVGIMVKELMNGQSNFSFDWEVKATRKSGSSFQVIRNK